MKKIILIVQLSLVLLLSGCNEWLDVNTDPNNPSEVESRLVLPAAQAQIAGSLGGDYAPLMGIWSQHWTQSNNASQFTNEDAYSITKANYNTPWRELYSDALIDLNFVRTQSIESSNWNAYLQSSLLMAYTYQLLTDFYGQIPFSEALKGEEGLIAPKFDTGKDVYDGIIKMIDEAMSKDFSANTNKVISSDLIFGDLSMESQIQAWIKFGNTLKLKIFMRQTKARPGIASAGVMALLADDNFLDSGAAISKYTDEPDRSYPIYESLVRNLNVATNIRGSHTFISYLLEKNDPRIDVLFVAGAGGHFGLAQGAFGFASSVVDAANVDYAVFDPAGAFYFFAPDEVEFLLSEANLRYGGASLAETHYNSAVTLAFQRLNVDGSMLLDSVYKYPSGTFDENLDAIIMQKWVASVERGHEAFFDQNRTGIPRISTVAYDAESYVPGQYTYSISGTTSGLFPKRLIFPDRTTRNNPNSPKDVPLTTPVWWAE